MEFPPNENGIPSQRLVPSGLGRIIPSPDSVFLVGQTFHIAAVHIYVFAVLRQLTAASQIDKSTALIAYI
jgi:hypothetical protein